VVVSVVFHLVMWLMVIAGVLVLADVQMQRLRASGHRDASETKRKAKKEIKKH
jgi:uncharacterized membrane protein